jgi:hypothetical protein
MPLDTHTEIYAALAASLPHMEILQRVLSGDTDVEQDLRLYASYTAPRALSAILARACKSIAPALAVTGFTVERHKDKYNEYTVFVCTLRPRDPLFDLIGADDGAIGWSLTKST